MRAPFGLVSCTAIVICVGLACRDASLAEGERAVRDYCEAVIVAYRTRDVTPLEPVTTAKELRKTVVLIDLKTADGLVLESTLEEMEVTSVQRPSPGMMTVATTERWRYFDRPLEVGKPPGTEFVVETDLEYTFVQGNGGWRMDQARTLRHEYLQPESYSRQQHVPHGEAHGEAS